MINQPSLILRSLFASSLFVFLLSGSAHAQTTAFTYQGKLTDNNTPPAPLSGNFDFQFKLFDAASLGTQVGATLTFDGTGSNPPFVVVTSGIFTVNLDFGACPTCFNGAARFLEIAVKPHGGGAFTTLTPRQQITSTPYAIKTQNLIFNGPYNDGLMPPTVLTASNTFAGDGAGLNTTPNPIPSGLTGKFNSFFGAGAGQANTTGIANAFFGTLAGNSSTTGGANVFFGSQTGQMNTNGQDNTFFGAQAGFSNTTGVSNTLIGRGADFSTINSTGNNNTALGFRTSVTSNLTNATAIGGQAAVTQSHSLVLGAILGSNNCLSPGCNSVNVGIGTTAPAERLHVSGAGIIRARINSDSNAGLALTLNNQPGWSVATVSGGQFQIFNDAIGQNAIFINSSNNNVGLGTTGPVARLHIIASSNNAADNTATFLAPSLGANASHIHYGTTGDWYIRSAAAGGKVVLQDLGGNVGIGTSMPAEKLDVNGNLKFSGTISGNGSGLTNLNGANITSGTVTSAQLSPESVPNSSAFKLLGSLRWDLLKPQANFPAGNNPNGVAFDGANIWVANAGSNSVTKLRASDGANLGGFAVGTSPRGVAFDGANIWVANSVSNNVTKLRASDGASLGTFTVGTSPLGVAFDGANIWVANSGSSNVTKLRASDGECVGTCTFTVGFFPGGVAFDGANIWLTNGANGVTKLRATDGLNFGTFPVGSGPIGVAFDGANIWVANNSSGNVTKLRASDGACVGTCTFSVGTNPNGVAFDGANIWVAIGGNVTKLRASDGAFLGSFPVGIDPTGVAFDGTNIWVTNASSNNITRLMPAFPQP
jgi:hypothetical protein